MPPKRSTPPGYELARRLRKVPTPAESKLWAYLRGNKWEGINFRRQHAIGKYVVDFCALKAKLVIELDGSQHLEQKEYDMDRMEFLRSKGHIVLRFWNSDVMNNIETVMIAITNVLKKNYPKVTKA
jgi:very-short-patch-repair endonuclease